MRPWGLPSLSATAEGVGPKAKYRRPTRFHERRWSEETEEAWRRTEPLRARLKIRGNGRHAYAPTYRHGRVCRVCMRFRRWFDPETLRPNFHRQSKSVTGFLPTCKECTNLLRRLRRLETGRTRKLMKWPADENVFFAVLQDKQVRSRPCASVRRGRVGVKG